jgi:phospholipid/cholesterol/gamma-HCH transport system substrate-binding protein
VQGRSTEFRVGIFVSLALIVGCAIVFVLGSRSSMFASRINYRAIFANVDGLRPGSPVRMAGIDVGTVDVVHFLPDGRCEVVLRIREEESRFVTATSVASIGSKGLLGDKLVDVSPGTGEPLPANGEIQTGDAGGIFAAAGAAMESAGPAIENVRLFTETLADEQFRADLRSIAANIAEVTRMVREDDGTIHRLLSDPELADSIESTLESAQVATRELSATARNVRGITTEIQSGDGSVHELIYGHEGTRLITNLADTAGEAATVIRDIRTGEGNAHELLYGDSAGDLITNLTNMTADLAAISAEVRAGRGTLGGLLMDPSIYEDVRRIVGNIERNDILRALVRYSIREDEPIEPDTRAEPGPNPDQAP